MNRLPEIVQRYLDAYNRKDVAAFMACFTDDVVFENVANGAGASLRLEGKAALGQLAEQSVQAFTQRQSTVERVVGQGDDWAVEVRFTGVPAIDLPNGWRAGQPVALRGASFIKLRAGLICELVDLS